MNPEDLIVGTIYKTPSGLGGIFRLKYVGQALGRHVFLNQHEGWQHPPWNPFILDDEQVGRLVSPYPG